MRFLLLLLMTMPAAAAMVGTNAFDYQVSIAVTNNGGTSAVANVSIPTRVFLIQHSGITGQLSSVSGTNSLRVEPQFSFDGSNWTTKAVYIPPRTNSTVDTFQPDFANVTVYMRVLVKTTNTITVGVTSVKPN